MDNIHKIPVFPLPIVVFPDEEIRLHIFEPRYKQLIQDCFESEIIFAIAPIVSDQIQSHVALVKLKEIVKTYVDGRMDITLECIGKAYSSKFFNKLSGKLYGAIESHFILDTSDTDPDLLIEVKNHFNSLCEINHAQPYHVINWNSFKSYKLGHYVGFNINDEYEFSMLTTEKERLQKLISQLERMITQSNQRQEWLRNMNLNGEFRSFNKELL